MDSARSVSMSSRGSAGFDLKIPIVEFGIVVPREDGSHPRLLIVIG